MTTISHKNLSGTQLHETKGIGSAADNTVATSITNATTWAKLTNANLLYGQLLHAREQQASNTVSACTATINTWSKLTLNTTVTNEITSATVTASVVSLPAGTYEVEGYCIGVPFAGISTNKLRLRNTTDSSTLVVGRNVYVQGTTGSIGNIYSLPQVTLKGRFTLSGTKNVEFQYWQNGSTRIIGDGIVSGDGEVEVFTEIYIKKIA